MYNNTSEVHSLAMEAAIRSQPAAGETVEELIERAKKIAAFISGQEPSGWVEPA